MNQDHGEIIRGHILLQITTNVEIFPSGGKTQLACRLIIYYVGDWNIMEHNVLNYWSASSGSMWHYNWLRQARSSCVSVECSFVQLQVIGLLLLQALKFRTYFYTLTFLALAKLRRLTTGLVRSVFCLSVRPHATSLLPLVGFSWSLKF
jgi:hypothetical protein